jgi:predicted ArsR family transcriptional regulator
VSVDGRTRDAVARIVLESGPQSAAALAGHLQLSPAAIRRHLDALVADGLLAERAARPTPVRRGRGRPARTYQITDAGRAAFPHAYDDLATTALRYLREQGGDQAVTEFAEHRARTLVDAMSDATATRPTATRPTATRPTATRPTATRPTATRPTATRPTGTRGRVEALAGSLTASGYAATVDDAPNGAQLCQHHCPVAHVAAEFPELCEAETRAFAAILGTYVQRLATIAHGDGVCTTYVPAAAANSAGRTST